MQELQTYLETLHASGSVTLEIKVIPRASKSGIAGCMDDGTLKVKLAAVPEKGKANAELIKLLAELFDVPKSNVSLLAGETSQHKRVSIQRS